MPFYFYLIQSETEGTFYKGSSENPLQRLQQHTDGLSQYTSAKRPWKLVFVEELPFKKEMLIREKKLKHRNVVYFAKLIGGDKNILEQL
jgi:putative endonuclease